MRRNRLAKLTWLAAGLTVAWAASAGAALPRTNPDSVRVRVELRSGQLFATARLSYAASAAGAEAAFLLGVDFGVDSVRGTTGPLAWSEQTAPPAAGQAAARRVIVPLPPPAAGAAERPRVRFTVSYHGAPPAPDPWALRLDPRQGCLPIAPGAAPWWVIELPGCDPASVGGAGRAVDDEAGGAVVAVPLPCVCPCLVVSRDGPLPWRASTAGDATALACLAAEPGADAGPLARRALRLLAWAERAWGPWPWQRLLVVADADPAAAPRSWPGLIELPASARADTSLAADVALLHELLHGWFGLAVRAPAQGDWSEGLCALLADHDLRAHADPAAAATFRHGLLWQFTQLAGGPRDVPLADCPAADPASAPLTYGKGLFFQLALRREVGAERFHAGWRELLARRRGAAATWADVYACLAVPGDTRLAPLFGAWLEQTGAPRFEIREAGYDRSRREVRLTVAQLVSRPTSRGLRQRSPWPLRLPIQPAGSSAPAVWVVMDHTEATWRLPVDPRPSAILVDPQWEVFRLIEGDGRLAAPINGSAPAPARDRR